MIATDHPRQLIGWGLAMTALAVALASALFIARDALILIYISLLIAIGFGPVVRAIEHQHLVPVGTKRLPRWLAILVVYFVIIGVLVGIAALVVPPLVDQAQELWRELPSLFNRAQTYLIKWGLMARRITLEEAVQSVPAGASTKSAATSAVGTVATAIGTVVKLVFASSRLSFSLSICSSTASHCSSRLPVCSPTSAAPRSRAQDAKSPPRSVPG